MTAPVQQQADDRRVTNSAVNDDSIDESVNGPWLVSFVMPAQYSLQALPTPNNPLVTLKQIPAQYFAAIQFSGTSSASNLDKHEQALHAYLTDKQSSGTLELVGSAKYAFYNPPWTPPFKRRNEVMFEVKL